MSELAASDLDRSTALAWRRFQARLADHLADMGEGDVLVVEAEANGVDGGAIPRVRFACFGAGAMVRGELSGDASLAEARGPAPGRCERLVRLGWHEPTAAADGRDGETEASFLVELSVAEADRLAVMSVQALREVFGIPHPAFLAAGDLEDAGDEVPRNPPWVPLPEAEDAPVTTPESYEELCDLVDAALTPLFGQVPEKDDDGDIPVPWGSSLVFVRVEEDAPVVQLFSVVVDGVTDLRRAAFEVNILNRDVRFLTFVLVEDRVVARMHVPAWPFVPEHLRSMLTGMSQQVDDLDEDLVARIGGRRACDPTDPPEAGTAALPADRAVGLPSDKALLTLLQLDADATGTLDPRLAAGVCGWDQELVLRLLRETEDQERAWRSSRNEALRSGDGGAAAACGHELAAWERTTSLLRRALRLVVERALGLDPGSGPTCAEPPQP